MVGGQRIQVGLPHAGKTAEVTIQPDTYQIRVAGGTAVAAPSKASPDIKPDLAHDHGLSAGLIR